MVFNKKEFIFLDVAPTRVSSQVFLAGQLSAKPASLGHVHVKPAFWKAVGGWNGAASRVLRVFLTEHNGNSNHRPRLFLPIPFQYLVFLSCVREQPALMKMEGLWSADTCGYCYCGASNYLGFRKSSGIWKCISLTFGKMRIWRREY